MGPPAIYSGRLFPSSPAIPPQCASKSASRVPMGTRRLAGRLTWPETVTIRWVSGVPSMASARAAAVATLETSTPTSAGSFPSGTSRPVTAWISCRSPP